MSDPDPEIRPFPVELALDADCDPDDAIFDRLARADVASGPDWLLGVFP